MRRQNKDAELDPVSQVSIKMLEGRLPTPTTSMTDLERRERLTPLIVLNQLPAKQKDELLNGFWLIMTVFPLVTLTRVSVK